MKRLSRRGSSAWRAKKCWDLAAPSTGGFSVFWGHDVDLKLLDKPGKP
jgi:hypothetical protein